MTFLILSSFLSVTLLHHVFSVMSIVFLNFI
nr:MAG TPA: hypothetical protein [Microviridae sp.]